MATNREPIAGKKARHRSWSFWLGLLISLGCLVWAVQALDWAAVVDSFKGVSYPWIGLSVLTVLLTIAARLARWMSLLYPRQARPGNVLAAMMVGQFLNYFAPARAGDVARAYFLGVTEGESKAWALGTVALEKLWDIWALLILVALLSFSTALPDWLVLPARGLLWLSLLALLLSWLMLLHRSRVVTWMARLGRFLSPDLSLRLFRNIELLFDGLEGLRQPRVWLWAAIWSAVVWGLGVLTNHTAAIAVGLSLPLSASMMLMAVLQMGLAVPSLPGRVGVFEGLCIVVLALFDVNQDSAFVVGLLLHAVVFVPPTLLGLLLVWRVGAANPHPQYSERGSQAR